MEDEQEDGPCYICEDAGDFSLTGRGGIRYSFCMRCYQNPEYAGLTIAERKERYSKQKGGG